MKKARNGPFWLGAFALSLAAWFTACQSTPTRTAAELRRLQGYWEGEERGDKYSITITGNSLHYFARTNHWFHTTFTLPAGTDPPQLHATIIACTPSNPHTGEVVIAIYKVEGGILTLAAEEGGAPDDAGKAPKSFDDKSYQLRVLRKASPKKGMPNQPKQNEPDTP